MKKPDNSPENSDKCVCPNCPLYTDCARGKGEKLYCARQKSECPMDNTKMCICGSCAVFSANGLSGSYFCINEIK